MSAIVRVPSGKYVYLYESKSYRDENGKPRSKRECVGRVDPVSGKDVFKPEYLERVLGTEKQPVLGDDAKVFSVNDIKESRNLEYGASYLLRQIGESTGLLAVLKSVLPTCYDKVFALAGFMVASGEPAMFCEDWLNRTDSVTVGKELTSQKISELLLSISDTQRCAFFENWAKVRQEQEFFALDITSVSSYSELINDVAWGYNRDHEKLPQINLCMLVGENSKLPVFSVVYNGALKDVSTLKTTLSMVHGVSLKNLRIVTDKGFASKRNIDEMLSNTDGVRFLLAIPFTLNFAKKQIESERDNINTLENTIVVGDDVFRGVAKECEWDAQHKINAHVFCNTAFASRKQNDLYGYVTRLKEAATLNPGDSKLADKFKRYLSIEKDEKSGAVTRILVRDDVVEKELLNSGWMVAVSNFVADCKEAISIYRTKDVVEKGFLRLKNCLDLARLRVHSDEAMQNKIFIGFIALILTAQIHKVMSDHNLYEEFTMKKLLKSLETLRVQYISGKRILYPLTARHKKIISAFGFDQPV